MKIIKRAVLALLMVVAVAWLVAVVNLNFSQHEYAQVSDEQLAQAKAYLGTQITQTPPEFEWKSFRTQAGVTLRGGLLENKNAKATVMVVPGFTGSIEMIMREITQIHAAGYRVATLEYRGQGLSHRPLSNHPEKGYVEDYGLLADEVGQYANHIRRNDLPLFFFSISKGAHITMRMAAQSNTKVDAYALIVPLIQVNSGDLDYGSLRTISNVMTTVGLGAAYTPGAAAWPGDELVFGKAGACNSNPETAQAQSALFAINKKLRTRGVTYKWIHETTQSSEKLLTPEFVKNITQPVKIYTAGIDALVRTDKAEQFCGSLAQCELKHFPKARHCITREDYNLYDGIIADAIDHFEQALVEL